MHHLLGEHRGTARVPIGTTRRGFPYSLFPRLKSEKPLLHKGFSGWAAAVLCRIAAVLCRIAAVLCKVFRACTKLRQPKMAYLSRFGLLYFLSFVQNCRSFVQVSVGTFFLGFRLRQAPAPALSGFVGAVANFERVLHQRCFGPDVKRLVKPSLAPIIM